MHPNLCAAAQKLARDELKSWALFICTP